MAGNPTLAEKMDHMLTHRFRGLIALTATLTVPIMHLIAGAAPVAPAAKPAPTRTELAKQFQTTVKPFLATYCNNCHGATKPQAQLNLTRFTDITTVLADIPHWTMTKQRVADVEMPPAGAKQPKPAERQAVVKWIADVRTYEANRTAGDPGIVLARRLSNSEYDNTIRDLTGVDLRPTKAFPVDPANQEGFDNSGESLTISPALAKKYYEAARSVAENLVLTSGGFAFASHPVMSEPDRDKFCVLRIVDFYRKQPTDIATYLEGTWRFKHRNALGKPTATLDSIAKDANISPKYLKTVAQLLDDKTITVGPIAKLQATMDAIPAPTRADETAPKPRFQETANWIKNLRRHIAYRHSNLNVPGEFTPGSYTNVIWKDYLYASTRRKFDPSRLLIGSNEDSGIPQDEAARAPYIASFTKFASIFPDTFYIDERGLMEYDAQYERSGRFLTGGTHNATSYFRDDAPLLELVLDDATKKTLDTLWKDFEVVAEFNERMYLQGIFYERNEAQTILVTRDAEFNFAKSEDRKCASPASIAKFKELYLAKAKRKNAVPETLVAYAAYFDRSTEAIERENRERREAEPLHRKALLEFAGKAWRRPLTVTETKDLQATYTALRTKDGLSHEDAIRDSVTRILLSPRFLYRVDLDADIESLTQGDNGFALTSTLQQKLRTAPKQTQAPLNDFALASKLSYFLWSSMPDAELLKLAAAGKLHEPATLAAQTKRMIKDPKVKALAVEFGGNWLDIRRFEEHSAVDRERFPAFDDNLRQAMFDEPVRFIVDGLQNNTSVLDWLYGKHTFVNGPLAKHYGMDDLKVPDDILNDPKQWVRVDNATRYSRGGLLPMAAFLTKNASGLRTSPVRRGYWVVKRVLGEYIPPPPAVVPELPKDEKALGDRTLRQALSQHRDNPACSGCLARFDSYGLVFEGFGPIGELRKFDQGGKPVDTAAPFPGGIEKSGVVGLQEYIKTKRQQDFLDNFGRKLTTYALGRTLQPSDDLLLANIQSRLRTTDYKIGSMIEAIVNSRQFRYRRASTSTTVASKE
jgi:mono/diheme cytochrome c family protein